MLAHRVTIMNAYELCNMRSGTHQLTFINLELQKIRTKMCVCKAAKLITTVSIDLRSIPDFENGTQPIIITGHDKYQLCSGRVERVR